MRSKLQFSLVLQQLLEEKTMSLKNAIFAYLFIFSQLLQLCEYLWLIGTCFEDLYSPYTMRYTLIPN